MSFVSYVTIQVYDNIYIWFASIKIFILNKNRIVICENPTIN